MKDAVELLSSVTLITHSFRTMSRTTLISIALLLSLYFTTGVGSAVKLVILYSYFFHYLDTRTWIRLFAATAKRDFRLVFRGAKASLAVRRAHMFDLNVVALFRGVVARYPAKAMLIDALDGRTFTFSQVEEESNRIANYLLGKGYKKGDSIALLMENCPEYVIFVLGMAKIGVVPALINTNLRKDPLVHSIRVAGCKAVVFGPELAGAVQDVKPDLAAVLTEFLHFNDDLKQALKGANPEKEPEEVTGSIHTTDPLLYIYTSGTTGLPKAVVIKHVRQSFICIFVYFVCGLRPEDVVYNHVPLYHSSGIQISLCGVLFYGSTVVIRKKFSASNFWKDCVKHRVTATNYIGEICRYLLATKPVPEEKLHQVRLMYGNGLRAEIWREFTTRFNIPNIGEFYGSTEGNSNICQVENKIGAVGSVFVAWPRFLQELILPIVVIKVEPESGEPIRGPDGFCIRAEPNEPGEFLGKIIRNDPVKDFEGYRDNSATKKKILSDVFVKGDVYFRSGDILVMDEFGWLYFKDRAGDTYRWKGENVSTHEVESVAGSVLGLKMVAAFGVKVENTDGRAGMMAVGGSESGDAREMLDKLHSGLKERLPAYARPLFVRTVDRCEMTGTFKLKKTQLQREGFDVNKIKDAVYFLDAKSDKYVPLTGALYNDISAGKVRV